MSGFTTVSLTLYAYQLASDTATEQRADAQQLWENLAKLCREVLDLSDLADFQTQFPAENGKDTRFLPLLGREQPSISAQNEHWTANLMPLRLHDLYAVDFTLSPKQSPLSIEQLRQLNPQGCLLPDAIQSNFGQTLLLYLQADAEMSINKALIHQCLVELWQDSGKTTPEFVIEEMRLFGSALYECTSIAQAYNSTPLHVMVWIGQENAATTLQLAGQYNYDLMKLLAARRKVEYVRRNAQINYEEARKVDRGLKDKNEQFTQLTQNKTNRLEELEALLQGLPQDAKHFSDQLRALNDHQLTLAANLHNYQKVLTRLQAVKTGDDLQVWQSFYDDAKENTEQQLGLFKGYLAPTQPLFQELTQNIQGLIQIETLKHEFTKQERLERLVVFIASVLESAAISVKVAKKDFAQHFFGQSYAPLSDFIGEHLSGIVAHLGVGLLFGGLAFGILFAYQAWKKG